MYKKDATPSHVTEHNVLVRTGYGPARIEHQTNMVVAIGASDGGSEPTCLLLSRMPSGIGLIFLIIQALASERRQLPNMLAAHTTMHVSEGSSGTILHPDHVYVIPPHLCISKEPGPLKLSDSATASDRLPIDAFLCSLADSLGERTIGIILSGKGGDGAVGLRDLRGAGGLTIIQSPHDALHPDMPRHAADLARPDFVLPALEMPSVLIHHAANLSTLTFRPTNIEAAIANLPITLGAFFRDAEAVDILAASVRNILRDAAAESIWRVWVPGCRTGEDAYALGVLLLEQIRALGSQVSLNIIATDVDEQDLFTAKSGILATSTTNHPLTGRIARYLSWNHGLLCAKPTLRDTIIFRKHNFLYDPPVWNADLVCCTMLSRLPMNDRCQAVRTFIAALVDEGLLVSEMPDIALGDETDIEPLHYNSSIFRRRRRVRSRTEWFRSPDIYDPTDTHRRRPGSRAGPTYTADPSRHLDILQDESSGPDLAAPNTFSHRRDVEVVVDELQSVKEHLDLVEIQLKELLSTQRRTSIGLSNLLETLSAPSVLLDGDLRINAFSARAKDIFSLSSADIGRPLDALSTKFVDPHLYDDVKVSTATGVAQKRDIRDTSGATYKRIVMPYCQEEAEIRSIILTVQDGKSHNEQRPAPSSDRTYVDELVNMAGAPRAAIDDGLKVVSANDEFCTQFGVQRDRVGGVPLSDLQAKSSIIAALQSLVPTIFAHPPGKTSTASEVLHIEDDENTWRATLRPIRLQTSQSSLVVLSLERLPSQKSAIRQQLELLIDAYPGPMLVTDPYGRIEFSSYELQGLLGYSSAELMGLKIDLLISPELRERHVALREETRATPNRRSMNLGVETIGLAKDGTRIPFSIRLAPVDTAAGQLIIVAIQDLRDMKAGEAERERLQSTLATYFQQIGQLQTIATQFVNRNDLNLMLDEILHATMLLQSAAFGQFLMYDRAKDSLKAVVSQGSSSNHVDECDLTFSEDGTFLRQAMQARVMVHDLEEDDKFAAHRVVASKAGYRAIQATPIFSRERATLGILVTCFRQPHSLSERELQLTDLYVRMAADLLDRASAESELQEARRIADEARRANAQLLAAAIHDMRQPLQSIRLLQGVLEQQVTNSNARVTLAKLGSTTEQMNDLVDGLLDLHQVETGRIKIDLSDLSLTPILTQVWNDFSPLATAKALDFRFVRSTAIVRANRLLLTRILGNLVSNAIKYTDKGKILVGCRRHGGRIRIEVVDTGIGIPSDKVHAIFGEFYRIQRAESSETGLGLGLHIVKRFAELLNCQIDIRSTPGKGTLVALVIPAAASPSNGNTDWFGSDGVNPSPPEILLVEDDVTQLSALASLLQQQGYRVAEARSGTEAMAHIRANMLHPPAVIVTDFNLQDGLSGIEIIQRTRRETNTEVPALILSGRLSDAQIHSDIESKIVVLSKPVKLPPLLATIETMVQRSIPDWKATGASRSTLAEPPTMADPLSEIAVIDDEPGVRVAIQAMLEFDGYKVETFASAEAFLADPGHGRFQCLVVDVSLGGIGGLELQGRLKREHLRAPVIFLTGGSGVPLAVRAMREGAADFLQKPVELATLRESITRVMEHDTATVPTQSQLADVEARLALLTKREREVMDRIVVGQLNKNISSDLNISERTTEHHRQSIMRKMGVKSLAMLVRMIAMAEQKRS